MMAPVGGRRRRAPVATFLVLGLLVASVYGLYNFLFRPGKLAIEVVPQDAVVRLDGEVGQGAALPRPEAAGLVQPVVQQGRLLEVRADGGDPRR